MLIITRCASSISRCIGRIKPSFLSTFSCDPPSSTTTFLKSLSILSAFSHSHHGSVVFGSKYFKLQIGFVRHCSKMPSAANGKNGVAFERLPKTVVPLNYNLTIEPDWTNETFEGSIVIDLEVKRETDVVVLNANHMSIKKISYKGSSDDASVEPEIFLLDLEQELLKINFCQPLKSGSGQLSIQYSGKVSDSLKGLFKSKYKGPNGEDRYHYLTKFEPTYARNCYPCWDEPSVKATYDITLIVPKNLVALSNMPVKEDLPHPTNIDKKIVTFERSVKMSTYVMAFAMGEFDYIESSTPDGILCRVYTPVGKKERGSFALDVVQKSLAFYKNYFGIPYPLPKMDLLSVAEFGSGAMENWGLVIFREQRLLIDEKLSSSLSKQYVAIVVAHETAHMWFGNLVTMEWWSDLWLNEGFATFMEFLCVDSAYPELNIWNIFIGDYFNALQLDASATSHPIQVVVENPAQIGSIFDSISYSKGASVIRMIHNFIGDDKFKEGMKHYLNQHLFGNAETKDLWAALTEKSGHAVDVIMPTFTEQMGYPIITVKDVRQDGEKKHLTLSYQKFWADPSSKDDVKYKWIIPITLRTQSDPKGVALKTLVDEEPGVEFQLAVDSKENEWVKVNADHVGYYRVTYPKAMLQNLMAAVKSKEMQPLDRAGILNDFFGNVQAGHVGSDEVLEFLLAYKDDDVFPVWSCMIDVIGTMDNLVRDTPLHEKLRTFARDLLSPTVTRLGWRTKENERAQDSVLRTVIMTCIVGLEDSNALQEARNIFGLYVRTGEDIPPDVRAAVYRAVALEGECGWEALLKVYRNTDLLEEKVRILAASAACNDKSVIQKLLEFGRSKEVNMQDIITILIALCNTGKQDIAWEYFKANWEFFRDSFPTGHFLIRMVVEYVTSKFKTMEKAAEIEDFFKSHQIKGIDRTLTQSLESIRIKKNWLERDTSAIQQFLSKR